MTDSVQLEDRTDAPPVPVRARRIRRPEHLAIYAIVVVLMAVSAVAHLWALDRDLPLPDTDEHFFVEPAVHIAATGSLNPEWFGHPGSTVIYPTAVLIHGWDALAHGGPLLSANDELGERFDRTPTPFYVIARLWTITLGVASLPLLFALGRRVFNTSVALMATALWAVLPLPVHFGRLIRTESAGTFFALLTLWCCVRALDEPRAKWWILAGAGTGLAVSSRYFMVALIPCVAYAVVVPKLRDIRAGMRAGAISAAAFVVAFVVTTPYFFLDFDTVRDDIEAEATVSHPVAEGLSRFGNARWYLTDAIPDALTVPVALLAVAGMVLMLRKKPKQRHVLLVLYCAVFFVGISISKYHWQRWTIQLLPVLLLFAAAAVNVIARALNSRTPSKWNVGTIVPVVVTAALAITPIMDLIDVNQVDARETAKKKARDWLIDNAEPDSRVVHSPRMFQYPTRRIAPLGNGVEVDYDLQPSTDTLASYADAGYDYAVVGSGERVRFLTQRDEFPTEGQFYEDLACTTRLVAQFDDTLSRGGSVSIYDLDEEPAQLLDYFCSQPAPVDVSS